jgi:hypothetical protein
MIADSIRPEILRLGAFFLSILFDVVVAVGLERLLSEETTP